MTTGRINQVTIVRRGWPRHPGGRRESSKLLVEAPESHAVRCASVARQRRERHSGFPLFVPKGAPWAAPERGLGAYGGGLCPALQPFRRPRREVAPCQLREGVANGQESTEPLLGPAGVASHRRSFPGNSRDAG